MPLCTRCREGLFSETRCCPRGLAVHSKQRRHLRLINHQISTQTAEVAVSAMVTFSEAGVAIFIKAINNNILQLSRGMPKLNSVWLVGDCLYSLTFREGLFSETHMQPGGDLFIRTGATAVFRLVDRNRRLQHLVGAHKYPDSPLYRVWLVL